MPNKQLILKLIKKLREFIVKAKILQQHSFEDYERKVEVNFSIDRILQLLVECTIDLGKDIINSLNFEKPESYQHVFIILSKNRIISSSLCKELRRLARFRNRLVHGYLYIDIEEIYQTLQKDLKYFEGYLKEIEDFIKRQK